MRLLIALSRKAQRNSLFAVLHPSSGNETQLDEVFNSTMKSIFKILLSASTLAQKYAPLAEEIIGPCLTRLYQLLNKDCNESMYLSFIDDINCNNEDPVKNLEDESMDQDGFEDEDIIIVSKSAKKEREIAQ